MGKELGEALRRARTAKGLTIKAVADYVGISASAVSQWEAGATDPSLANLQLAGEFLGVEPTSLKMALNVELARESKRAQVERDRAQANVTPAYEAPKFENVVALARDIPVLGTAVGGEDADFRFNGQEIDRALRPPGLAEARGIFALYLTNDSMYPAWREGALFYVNPHRTPSIGDDVVIEEIACDPGEPGRAYMKRLKARSATKYIVEQFNPPKELTFERSEVQIYRVVPWDEALGLS